MHGKHCLALAVALVPVWFLLPRTIAAEPPKVDLTHLAVNTWLEVCTEKDANKYLCSTWYMPATDEFLMWGRVGGEEASPKYDVETLAVRTGRWCNSFPRGKEKAWDGGRFPNWSYKAKGEPKYPVVKDAQDRVVTGFMLPNRVRFVETEGVPRPTRCPTFHQATYDSKRGRMLFFVGGQTFSYDPRQRAWKDLRPEKSPLACDALVWASLCYDPVNDEAVLFGGGMALTPEGGARTWIYDCARNIWYRPALKPEPPPRCNARLVYDAKNKLVILFGGDDQARLLADTWVYDVTTRTWTERKPRVAPPPTGRYAACFVEKHGMMLMCVPGEKKTCSTWTFDAARDLWVPVKGTIPEASWLSCDYSAKDDVIVLATASSNPWSSARSTYVYRLDPASAAEQRPAGPGSFAWKHAGQMGPLVKVPAPARPAMLTALKELPANRFVEAGPPAAVINKTWGTATCDTERGEVIYTGGGHSGYSGNDFAHYNVGDNRWFLSWPPCFPPFLEGTNASVFGWSYGLRPWSQHTYRWYAYDPQSRMVVYCARPMPLEGRTILLEENPDRAFVYEEKKHGQMTWVYDPARKKLYPPSLGRPFGNPWNLSLIGTPRGVYASFDGKLHRCQVKEGKASWLLVDAKGPSPKTGFHYEFQPLVYDSKRDRLVLLMGKDNQVEVYARKLKEGASWVQLQPRGTAEIARELVYVPRHDVLLLLGKEKLFVLDCGTLQWRLLDVEMPRGGYGVDAAMVYDPVHDVCVLLLQSRSAGPNRTYRFRFEPKTARYK